MPPWCHQSGASFWDAWASQAFANAAYSTGILSYDQGLKMAQAFQAAEQGTYLLLVH